MTKTVAVLNLPLVEIETISLPYYAHLAHAPLYDISSTNLTI
jgi:hypothetical protein